MKVIKNEYYSHYGEFEKIVAEDGAIIDAAKDGQCFRGQFNNLNRNPPSRICSR